MPVEVAAGHKFALMAVPESRGGPCPRVAIDLGAPYIASHSLPNGALDTWEENVGKFHVRELNETDVFLWAVRPSDRPEELNHESLQLRRQVHQLYLGLLMALPFHSCGRLTLLTGHNAGGGATVRSLTAFPRTHHTVGSPSVALSAARLRLAAELAGQLTQHDRTDGAARMNRAIRAFRVAKEARPLDVRLHQFTRCCEAFAVPPFGNSAQRFAERLSRICAGRSVHALRQTYQIRSGIEHLKGPYARMPRRLSKKAAHERLVLRTVEIETLARFLLIVYLKTQALWPHFRSSRSVGTFWNMSESDFRELWPSKFALSEVPGLVEWAVVEEAFEN